MTGKMHPPTPAPPNEQEIARPSRLLNQCVMTMFPILKNTPVATCQHAQILELSSIESDASRSVTNPYTNALA